MASQHGLSRAVELSLTSSTEKVGKHVERISVASLTAFVSLETFLREVVSTYTETAASFDTLLHDDRIFVVSVSLSTDCV